MSPAAVPTGAGQAHTGWPTPGDALEHSQAWRWQPAPAAAELITPMFRGMLASRLVTATVAHANHALQNLGVPASEPGPHALLLLSAEPQHPLPQPDRPSWWSPALPDADEPPPTALVRIASRLVGVGDGDDLLKLLSDLSGIAAKNVDAAAADGKLLHLHNQRSRAALAAMTLDEPWAPPAEFPYAQALAQGVLWDPRMPHTGLAPTNKEPLTAGTTYLGVAVTTLDTPTGRWMDGKDQWRGARDPDRGLPVTAASLPGTAWAALEDGTAMHIERTPSSTRESRTHTVVTNAPVIRGYDRLTALDVNLRLVQDSPPLPRLPQQSAQLSADLWDHLADLHIVLRRAFGYEGPA